MFRKTITMMRSHKKYAIVLTTRLRGEVSGDGIRDSQSSTLWRTFLLLSMSVFVMKHESLAFRPATLVLKTVFSLLQPYYLLVALLEQDHRGLDTNSVVNLEGRDGLH